MRLDDLKVYQLAMELGDTVWDLTADWDRYARRTMGTQLVRAGDSIAANISEGFGRYHYAENRQFCYYARGSLYETKNWLRRAYQRDLLNDEQVKQLQEALDPIAPMLNAYLRSLKEKE